MLRLRSSDDRQNRCRDRGARPSPPWHRWRPGARVSRHRQDRTSRPRHRGVSDFAPLAVQPARCESGTPFAGLTRCSGRSSPDRDSSGVPGGSVARRARGRGHRSGPVTHRRGGPVPVVDAGSRPPAPDRRDDAIGSTRRPRSCSSSSPAGGDRSGGGPGRRPRRPAGGSWEGADPLAVSPLLTTTPPTGRRRPPRPRRPRGHPPVKQVGQPLALHELPGPNRRSCRRHGARGPRLRPPSPSACRPCRPRHAVRRAHGRGSCRR